jgi:response regulator of citrate/malate metabolism
MRILIIEDLDIWQAKYRQQLPAEVEIVQATSLADARVEMATMVINEEPFDAIIVDGYFDGEEADTMNLIERFRASGFPGPLIAASGSSEYNELLMQAGCTHNAKDKTGVVPLLLKILNLPPA